MKTIRLLWRLTRGYRIRPWRSPYLRWRMETYWGLHAERIGCREFWVFVWDHRADLLRYANWAVGQDCILQADFQSASSQHSLRRKGAD